MTHPSVYRGWDLGTVCRCWRGFIFGTLWDLWPAGSSRSTGDRRESEKNASTNKHTHTHTRKYYTQLRGFLQFPRYWSLKETTNFFQFILINYALSIRMSADEFIVRPPSCVPSSTDGRGPVKTSRNILALVFIFVPHIWRSCAPIWELFQHSGCQDSFASCILSWDVLHSDLKQ